MIYNFRFTSKADKQFSKLDKPIKHQILDYLEKNIEGTDNPRMFGKALQGDLNNYWRYRIGKYRLIAEIKDQELLVLGLAIGKRNDIYKR